MDLLKQLREANIKGVAPPQNWTHRAIEAIEKLQTENEQYKARIKELELKLKIAESLIDFELMTEYEDRCKAMAETK